MINLHNPKLSVNAAIRLLLCYVKHSPAILNGLKTFPTLASKIVYLLVQNLDQIIRTINRRPEFPPFPLPAVDAIHLCASPSLFRFNLVADLAFLGVLERLHDKLHTAGFTRAVFSVAMLPEVSPFPIAAGKLMLIKEAHI